MTSRIILSAFVILSSFQYAFCQADLSEAFDDYTITKFEPVSSGFTELYTSNNGIIVNAGRNGKIGFLKENKTIEYDYIFDYLGDCYNCFYDWAKYPGAAETRFYNRSNEDPLMLVTKERDNDFNYSPLDPDYEPEFIVSKFGTNGFYGDATLSTVINGNDLGPLDVAYDFDDGYYVFDGNLIGYLSLLTGEMKTVSFSFSESYFFQNYLHDVFIINDFSVYKLNQDLTFDLASSLPGFLDIRIYDEDKILVSYSSYYEIYNSDFSLLLESNNFLVTTEFVTTNGSDIYSYGDSKLFKIDLLNNHTEMGNFNSCLDNLIHGIEAHDDGVLVYGGSKDVVFAKSIDASDVNVSYSQNNIISIIDFVPSFTTVTESFTGFGNSGDFITGYEAEFKGGLVIQNLSDSTINQIDIRIENPSMSFNSVEISDNPFKEKRIFATLTDLNIQPNAKDTVDLVLEFISPFISFEGFNTSDFDKVISLLGSIKIIPLAIDNEPSCFEYDFDLEVFKGYLDKDEDGFLAWEDCDDLDSLISIESEVEIAFGVNQVFGTGCESQFCFNFDEATLPCGYLADDLYYTWLNESGDTIGNEECISISTFGEFTAIWDYTYVDSTLHSGTQTFQVDLSDFDLLFVENPNSVGCTELSGIVYSVEPIGNDVEYFWSITNGVIESGQGTSQILISKNDIDVTTEITVYAESDECGQSQLLATNLITSPSNAIFSIQPLQKACIDESTRLDVHAMNVEEFIWEVLDSSMVSSDNYYEYGNDLIIEWNSVGPKLITVTAIDSEGCYSETDSLFLEVFDDGDELDVSSNLSLVSESLCGSFYCLEFISNSIPCGSSQFDLDDYDFNIKWLRLSDSTEISTEDCVNILESGSYVAQWSVLQDNWTTLYGEEEFNVEFSVEQTMASVEILPVDDVCIGGWSQIELIATDASSYIWTISDNTAFYTSDNENLTSLPINWTTSGVKEIVVSILDINGCPSVSDSITIEVVNELPSPIAFCSSVTESSLTIEWEELSGYDVAVQGAEGEIVENTFTANNLEPDETYIFNLFTEGEDHPCGNSEIVVLGCSTLTTNINDVQLNNYNIMLAPNPASEFSQFLVEGESLTNATLSLINLEGKEVLNTKVSHNTTIDLSSIPVGMYFYEVFEESQIIGNGKLVVVK